jgi:filamentous hemagglutinin
MSINPFLLNRTIYNINKNLKKTKLNIYDVKSNISVSATVDTRMLTKDGRNAIKEDLERTKRLGTAIAEVATSDAFKIKDTFDHIDDVQKDLDVQKAMALKNNGKLSSFTTLWLPSLKSIKAIA